MTQELPTDSALSTLSTLGQQLYEAEAEVLELKARLKQAEKKALRIATEDIPSALEEVGVRSIEMTGGRKIEIKETLSVKPKADNRPLVMQDLVERGAGNLIKTTVMVPFNRGEDEKVTELLKMLQTQGLQTKAETKVEPSTLRAHVKKLLEAGTPVDMELYGVRQFKRAIFSEGAPVEPIFDGEDE